MLLEIQCKERVDTFLPLYPRLEGLLFLLQVSRHQFKFFLIFCHQLLDSFVIPVLMILSWWVLKTRYGPVHYVAVCICLLGVGAMVGADLLAGRDQGSSKFFLQVLICDEGLCLSN